MMSFFQSLIFLALGFFPVSAARMKQDSASKNFEVLWNVPTVGCRTHGNKFDILNAQFGITTNLDDNFRGEEIVILYEPGFFPVMFKDENNNLVKKNGGIPQHGNLTLHLIHFVDAIETAVSKDFSGIGIIDFEVWRPIFRQNWNNQTKYTLMSKDLEKQNNSKRTEAEILDAAKIKFEDASKKFMEGTLKEAKKLRPNAFWGYYGFPYCYNYNQSSCPKMVENENDQIKWLWEESTSLYPSMYIPSTMSVEKYEELIKGRLSEVDRIKNSISKKIKVFPYVWFQFNNEDKFLPQTHIETALKTIKSFNIEGAIIWGSSDNVSTKKKCQELYDYVHKTLGPVVKNVVTTLKGFVNLPFVPQIPLLIAQRLNKTLRPHLSHRQKLYLMYPFQLHNYKN